MSRRQQSAEALGSTEVPDEIVDTTAARILRSIESLDALRPTITSNHDRKALVPNAGPLYNGGSPGSKPRIDAPYPFKPANHPIRRWDKLEDWGSIRFTLLALAACGSVSNSKTDAPPSVDVASPDAAWTNNALWQIADGLPDQACVPWTLTDTAAPENPAIVNGHLTLATDVDNETMMYKQEPPALQMPTTTFVIEARVRFVSGMSNDASRSAVDFGWRLGGKSNILRLEDGAIFLLADSSTRGPSLTTPTSDMFHDYKVEVLLASGAIAVSRDGVNVLNGTAYATTGTDIVHFGDGTGLAYGISEWSRVSHNAHVLGPCP